MIIGMSSLENQATESPSDHQQLKKEITALYKIVPYETLNGDNNFLNYFILKERTLFEGKFSKMYACFNYQYGEDNVLVCRIFEKNARIEGLFLKILRNIGNRHASIVGALDIFCDESKRIWLFQEFADCGNCLEYLCNGNQVDEKQMLEWGQSLYRAIDFLVSIGISHRSISPKHVLLKQVDSYVVAKLSGFRDAIIYFDHENDQIIEQPCRSVRMMKYANFQAPEMFSDEGRQYNPIVADVWSLGATMFYIIEQTYPFNLNQSLSISIFDNIIDDDIRETVLEANSQNLSEPGKRCLYSLLRANPQHRLKLDDLAQDQWFSQCF